jgi:putative holliday junction resolvase
MDLGMPEGIYIGFDFGFKRIGMAVGQRLTCTASPLETLQAVHGVPEWSAIQAKIEQWKPQAFVVGLPTCIDDRELYTTSASRRFAAQLKQRFLLPVHLIDERLSTIEARAHLFAEGGYRKLKKSEVDSIAACIILERWLQET